MRIAYLGSWYWDAKTDENIVSNELLRIFGQVCLPFQKQSGTMYPPESWDILNAAVQKAVQTRVGYELDLEALKGNGDAIWITARSKVVRDTNQEIIGLHGTVQDVTDRKKVESALYESECIYRAIGESIDYGVWICDPNGHNIYASPSFLKMVGITQQQCSDFGWGDTLHTQMTPNVQSRRGRNASGPNATGISSTASVVWMDSGTTCWRVAFQFGTTLEKLRVGPVSNLDINDIVKTEAALQESEERLRFALESF
jgi:PAS domain S-box-containing protein